MARIRVLFYGLGPIGLAIARQVAERPGFAIVGAVDIDPAKVGRGVDELLGLTRPKRHAGAKPGVRPGANPGSTHGVKPGVMPGVVPGVKVSADAARTIRAAKPDVVVLCTHSSIKGVLPQVEAILQTRTPIVSTTEELSYPFYTHVRQANQIDAWAKKAKVAVLATGVNPGFAMDALPIALTAVCERVDRVSVHRVQDARVRRLPFQQKIGAGLTTEQFQRKVSDGSVRHVGLTESIAMIADAIGWELDRITDDIQPKLAAVTVSSEYLAVDPGYVCGIVQDGVGYRGRTPVIRLHMEAYLGAPESYDAVEIEGHPSLSMKIAGGIHGDVATASMVVNAIPKVLRAAPGLHTMRDMPLPSFEPGR